MFDPVEMAVKTNSVWLIKKYLKKSSLQEDFLYESC